MINEHTAIPAHHFFFETTILPSAAAMLAVVTACEGQHATIKGQVELISLSLHEWVTKREALELLRQIVEQRRPEVVGAVAIPGGTGVFCGVGAIGTVVAILHEAMPVARRSLLGDFRCGWWEVAARAWLIFIGSRKSIVGAALLSTSRIASMIH